MVILKELMKKRPTIAWEQRLSEGDINFTEENIAASNRVLESFLNSLEKITSPDEQKIQTAVKSVVIEFNKLNETYNGFIETLEREELCDFIDEALQLIGYEPEEDITEEWREW